MKNTFNCSWVFIYENYSDCDKLKYSIPIFQFLQQFNIKLKPYKTEDWKILSLFNVDKNLDYINKHAP